MGRFTQNNRVSSAIKPLEGVFIVLLFLAALVVLLGLVMILVRLITLGLAV